MCNINSHNVLIYLREKTMNQYKFPSEEEIKKMSPGQMMYDLPYAHLLKMEDAIWKIFGEAANDKERKKIREKIKDVKTALKSRDEEARRLGEEMCGRPHGPTYTNIFGGMKPMGAV
jgi:hypothetical protein